MATGEYIISINAENYTLTDDTITYEQIVKLAYPDAVIDEGSTFAVTFEHAKEPKEGTLAAGRSVVVKERNTEFDVVPANRA